MLFFNLTRSKICTWTVDLWTYPIDLDLLFYGMPFFLMKMEFAKFSDVYVESHDKSLFGHELLNDIA